jgi:hypothetical protein
LTSSDPKNSDPKIDKSEPEHEGVIKFSYHHITEPLSSRNHAITAPLFEWRELLFARGMIGGGDPSRYHGDGFGNISARLPESRREADPQFLITGSQTGHLSSISLTELAYIRTYSITRMEVESQGEVLPSSESLTHAMIYQLHEEISWVFHVHSPDLWRARSQLDLPSTPIDVPYGTQEMASAVKQLFIHQGSPMSLIFAMAGHEDGIISFGRHADEAGALLLKLYAKLNDQC